MKGDIVRLCIIRQSELVGDVVGVENNRILDKRKGMLILMYFSQSYFLFILLLPSTEIFTYRNKTKINDFSIRRILFKKVV